MVDPGADLTRLTLDDLMNVQVYTPGRRLEKVSDTPAAVSVLTQEDIQRSGARSIPEALRLVPGLDVAQVDAEQWAISARGFNDVFANKLLVLEDGRSLYTPLFSGVFWNVQDTFMQDIDRIEVIRGPGASLWGANAVNGVINIITKTAKETQGVEISAGGGNIDRGFGSVRYGAQLGEDLYMRVYGTYFNQADSAFPWGGRAEDAWQKGQAGFRVDWDKTEASGNLLTLQGDAFRSVGDQIFTNFTPFTPPYYSVLHRDDHDTTGGNLMGRWTHTFSEDSELRLQVYYDRSEQDAVIFTEKRDTFDIDAQHSFKLGNWNNLVWGLGYRVSADHIGNSDTVAILPTEQSLQLFSGFVQDEIPVVPDKLRVTLGTKVEHNDYTAMEVQPSVRLLWTPTPHQTFWGAISRAVRTPSRAEEGLKLNQVLFSGPVPVVTIYGNPDFETEHELSYELGYRASPTPKLSLDLSLFYNTYDDLRNQELGPAPGVPPTAPPPPPVIPPFGQVAAHLGNKIEGDTYGFEFAPAWQLTDWWRLRPSYSLLQTQVHRTAGSTDTFYTQFYEGTSPQQQVSLRSSMDLPFRISLDTAVRYVDELPYFQISSYWAMDVRLAWKANDHLEVALVGQNLLSDHHAEFAPTFVGTQRTEVPWGIYAQATWSFGGKH